jgi:hypothetical protein
MNNIFPRELFSLANDPYVDLGNISGIETPLPKSQDFQDPYQPNHPGQDRETVDADSDPLQKRDISTGESGRDLSARLAVDEGMVRDGSGDRFLDAVADSSLTTEGSWAMVPMVLETKITANDGATLDSFGNQLSLDGNTMLVGSSTDDDNGLSSGSAYIFERVSGVWTQTAKLIASDGAAGDWFGDVLELDGNTALIGAWRDNLSKGSAYIFEKVGEAWTQTAKLTASDGVAGDLFGFPAIDDNTIMIGSPYDDDKGANSGSVDIFEKIGGIWAEKGKIYASDTTVGDNFGRYINIEGNQAIIGAESADGNEEGSGVAYIFERINGVWQQTARLTASDGETGDSFSRAVKIDGNTALIGAYGNDQDKGAAYIFEKVAGEWVETAKLTASDGAAGDLFGRSLTIEGGVVVVAARNDDDNGKDSGSVYLYEKINGFWTEIDKLVPGDGAAGDNFGKRVDLDGNTLAVGAVFDDDKVLDSGSVYIYHLDRAGNSVRDARNIGQLDGASTPQTFSDWLGAEDSRDFYRFELLSSSHFDLHLDGLSANANVFLYDSSKRQIASSRNPSNRSESISTTLAAGSYYVLARSADQVSTDYQLTLSAQSSILAPFPVASGNNFGVGEVDTLLGSSGRDTFVLGDGDRVYYDDGDPLTKGEQDYALILDFNAREDVIQLQGSADLYRLDFFPSSLGAIDAVLSYDPDVTARAETIGLLSNVSEFLSLSDPAFTFV